MNAHLMSAPSLQPAFDERVISYLRHNRDVGDSALACAGFGRAAAPAIPSITNQTGLNASRVCPAAHQRQITALDGVCTELPAKLALGIGRTGKNNQSACVFIEPVDCPETPALLAVRPGELLGEDIDKRGRQETATPAAELSDILGMTHGRYPSRLVHDNHVRIDMTNGQPAMPSRRALFGCSQRLARRFGRCMRYHNPLAALYSLTGIRTLTTFQSDTLVPDQSMGLRRGDAQSRAKYIQKGAVRFSG
jgi:hypothetical protein